MVCCHVVDMCTLASLMVTNTASQSSCLNTMLPQVMLGRAANNWIKIGNTRFVSTLGLKERKIGVIGLGNVGDALVKNLQRTG